MNMEVLMQYITYALIAIGILAFLTSIITQVIKEMPGLKNIQTNRCSTCDCADPVPVACGDFVVSICIDSVFCGITLSER